MLQTSLQITFEEFLACRPNDSIYELVNGEIVRIEATRAHKNVARFLMLAFNDEAKRLKLDYFADKDIAIRTVTASGQEQGRIPDVGVVLAVEVISTNWEDDYVDKLDEYQRLGIPEYWIVDYLAIASRAYLGNTKVPTVFVHRLIDGQYHSQVFTGSSRILCSTLSDLEVTVEQLAASRI